MSASLGRCPVLAVKQLRAVAFFAAMDAIAAELRERWVIAGGYAYARLALIPPGLANLSHWCAYAPGSVWTDKIGRGGVPCTGDFDESKAFADVDFFYVGLEKYLPHQVDIIASRDYGFIQLMIRTITGACTILADDDHVHHERTNGWKNRFDTYHDHPLQLSCENPSWQPAARVETNEFPSKAAAPVVHIRGELAAPHRSVHAFDGLGQTNHFSLIDSTSSTLHMQPATVGVQMISAVYNRLRPLPDLRAASLLNGLGLVDFTEGGFERCTDPAAIVGQFDLTCCALWIEHAECETSCIVLGSPSSNWLRLAKRGEGRITARALCARLPPANLAPDTYDVHITRRTFSRMQKCSSRGVRFKKLRSLKNSNRAFLRWNRFGGDGYEKPDVEIVRDLSTMAALAAVPLCVEPIIDLPTRSASVRKWLLPSCMGMVQDAAGC